MARRALIVGIDDYPDSPLQGCVADAVRLEGALSRHHDRRLNFECKLITAPSSTVTRATLREAVADLFRDPAEAAFFHFSGHGTINQLGGYLVTPDAVHYDVGVSMTEVLAMANASEVNEVFITLDCCHSGAFGIVPEVGNNKAILGDGVSVIAGTRAEQAALEEGGGGVFTSLLVDALEGGAAGVQGEVTAAGVYAYVDNALGAWDQRPVFKSNVSKFVRLRDAAPKVELETLHRLPELFPLPAEELPLDPSYEPSEAPQHEAHQRDFEALQALRDGGLVETVGEKHMYFAALNSGACRLTLLGRYYWRLVADNRL